MHDKHIIYLESEKKKHQKKEIESDRQSVFWRDSVRDLCLTSVSVTFVLYVCVILFITSVLLTLHTRTHYHSPSWDQCVRSWATNTLDGYTHIHTHTIYSIFFTVSFCWFPFFILQRSFIILSHSSLLLCVSVCPVRAGARDRLRLFCMNSLIPDLLRNACVCVCGYYRVNTGASSGEWMNEERDERR